MGNVALCCLFIKFAATVLAGYASVHFLLVLLESSHFSSCILRSRRPGSPRPFLRPSLQPRKTGRLRHLLLQLPALMQHYPQLHTFHLPLGRLPNRLLFGHLPLFPLAFLDHLLLFRRDNPLILSIKFFTLFHKYFLAYFTVLLVRYWVEAAAALMALLEIGIDWRVLFRVFWHVEVGLFDGDVVWRVMCGGEWWLELSGVAGLLGRGAWAWSWLRSNLLLRFGHCEWFFVLSFKSWVNGIMVLTRIWILWVVISRMIRGSVIKVREIFLLLAPACRSSATSTNIRLEYLSIIGVLW